MFEAISMAATGLRGQQTRLDTIADNIANTNTVGFKASRLDFKDALYSTWYGPAYTSDGNLQHGHGVMTAAVTREFDSGSITVTNNPFDFALDGEGFFEIQDGSGRILYTRAGNFYATPAPDGLYLVNGDGNYVLNRAGGRIRIPDGTDSISVSPDGLMTFKAGDVERTEQLGLYTFTNLHGLSSVGGSNYETTVASGEKIQAAGVTVRQGALEASNVELATEMTRMIRAQRAFSLAARALTTADDMEGIANNLRR